MCLKQNNAAVSFTLENYPCTNKNFDGFLICRGCQAIHEMKLFGTFQLAALLVTVSMII